MAVEKPTCTQSSWMRDGNHVWKTTPVNAVVLNVTLMQYVSQKSRPDEPPNAGPSEREIM